MLKGNFRTSIVTGRIGIIDAALVRYLENVKDKADRLHVNVAVSIYNKLIPKNHIEEFISNISTVNVVLTEQDIKHLWQQSKTAPVRLPEKDLQRYSVDRILKKVPLENQNNNSGPNKLIKPDELIKLYGTNPHDRKLAIGLVSGSFDLIHLGHVRYFNMAKEKSDILVVATMSTHSIRQQGKNVLADRPIYSQEDRVKVLSSIRSVDHIVVFDEVDCNEVIRAIKPNLFIKKDKDMSRPIVREECDLVNSLGGDIFVTRDDVGYASTAIIHHVRQVTGT